MRFSFLIIKLIVYFTVRRLKSNKFVNTNILHNHTLYCTYVVLDRVKLSKIQEFIEANYLFILPW